LIFSDRVQNGGGGPVVYEHYPHGPRY